MTLPFPQATINTGCQVDTGDGPGGVGSRFFGPGEDVLSRALNRAPWALVQNDEYLDGIISTDQKAYTEVGVLTSFGGGSIIIDPSGGAAGQVNYAGTLYLGDATWAGAGRDQEFLNTLFSVLDEDYNEVLVDGEEVVVQSLTGNALGDEFVSTATTLTLNKTLPSGNYRLAYGRGSSYADLPEYAFMRADVRGLQEAPGESGMRGFYVLDPSSTPNFPADFKGPTCLQDAIATLITTTEPVTLFLRAGTYTVHQSGSPSTKLTISDADITIIGEGTTDVLLDLQAGHDLTISGADRFQMQNVTVSSPGNSQEFEISGQNTRLSMVRLKNLGLRVYEVGPPATRGGSFFDRVTITGSTGLSVDSVADVHFTQCYFQQHATSVQPAAWIFNGSERLCFDGCRLVANGLTGNTALEITGSAKDISFRNCLVQTSNASSATSLQIDTCERVSFKGCRILAQRGIAVVYGDISGANPMSAAFEDCLFESDDEVIKMSSLPPMARMTFDNCSFRNTAGLNWGGTSTSGPVFEFITLPNPATTFDTGITIDNCYFYDRYFTGTGGVGPAPRALLYLSGPIVARNIVVDRNDQSTFWENGSYIQIVGDTTNGGRAPVVENVELIINCDGSPDTAATGDGMVAVENGSTLRNLTVKGPDDEWAWPLLYISGGDPAILRSVVDGVDIVQGTTLGQWWFPGAANDGQVATLDGYAELYRLNASDLGGETSSGSQALVHVGGSDCIVSNCLLGVVGRLLYVIRVYGDGDQNVRIEDNRIAFVDASGAGTWALAGVAAIYVYGGSGISRSGWIRNNHISWLTFMSTDADHPSDVHKAILLWTNVQMWTIEKNYVLTKTQAAAGGEFVICIQEPAYRGIAGGANNCIGNIAQDLGNINTPDIGDVGTPSSAVVTAGDPTNIGIQGV